MVLWGSPVQRGVLNSGVWNRRVPLYSVLQIFKSTVGHDFDLSRPVEEEPFREYNPLHDPHTRAFFHRPSVCHKLQRNGFVTSEMQVVCSLKEYSAYREFMECESMKLRKKQEEKTENEKKVGTSFTCLYSS